MNVKPFLYGIASFFPGFERFRPKRTGGTDSARYCYSVWMRHRVTAWENGFKIHPRVVAELGPGNSLGVGLAALISGADRYFAFDVVASAKVGNDLRIFDELVSLFEKKNEIPGTDEFPLVKPQLGSYSFPEHIFPAEYLKKAMTEARLERIRRTIGSRSKKSSIIGYRVPCHEASLIDAESVDLILFQAALEHVDDLKLAYRAMRRWLRPDGWISHQIDFRSHGMTEAWNGHWACSDMTWKLIRGNRPFLLNREPHSTHLKIMAEEGFTVVCDRTFRTESRLTRRRLAKRFWDIPEDDLTVSGAFIQAVKRKDPPATDKREDR